MDTKQFEEQIKKFTTQWLAAMQDLQVQFSLGKMEAAQAFEKQKEHFRNLVLSLKDHLDKTGDAAEEHTASMKKKLDDLLSHLVPGTGENKELFEQQKKKIEEAMKEVYDAGKKMYHTESGRMLKLFDSGSDVFKTGLEMLKLQFALGKMDARDNAHEAKEAMDARMLGMKENIEKMQKIGLESLEEWNKQLKDGFEKMRDMASGWMKK